MSIVETLTTWVGHEDSLPGWLALAGSAAIEYVFPPFPGDVVTVLAASLVVAASWSWWGVLSALMLGSVIGAALTFELGVRWARRRAARGHDSVRLDRLVAGFRRHGAIYLVLNRFVPGVRSLFFVAAGLAGMSRRAVYLYGAVSALLWNLLLFAAGAALGASYDRLERLVRTYTTVAIVALVAVVLGWALARWLRRGAA
ncbi:MAG: VTT domain-containing protein [Kofleriaceae bacterium]|nr:VTT domain-containing protein [Kofleriaceae bacterium]MCL4223843.1 VTT domain-containing protein [Myxococcales bacterium]